MNGLKNKILYGLCILTLAGGVISYQEGMKYEKKINQSLTEQVRKIDMIQDQLNIAKPGIRDLPILMQKKSGIRDLPRLTQDVERTNSNLGSILKQHPQAISEWEDYHNNLGNAMGYGILAGILGVGAVYLGIHAIRRNKKSQSPE